MKELFSTIILKDFKLKALSLALAVMLWFTVSSVGESRMSVAARVSLNSLPRDYIVTKVETEEVLVTLQGPVSILKGIRTRDVKVDVDLSDSREGRYTLNLKSGNVKIPKGVALEEIRPDYIDVTVDRTVEKRLKVDVKVDPKWSATYRVKTWYPAYVMVDGSRASLERREHVDTLAVDGDFRAVEEEVYVPLDLKGSVVRKVRPDRVRVVLGKN
jgi:YbbR domain-containing protein